MIYEMKGNFTGKFIIDELRKRSEQNSVYKQYGYFSTSGMIGNKSIYRLKFIPKFVQSFSYSNHLYYFFLESNHPTGAVINPEKEYEVNFVIGE